MDEKKPVSIQPKARDGFTSKWGFIMAAVGSAVGMANVWAFPYRTAKYGGASFLIPCLVCLAILMVTGVSAEIAFGRWGKTSPVGTFRKALELKKKPLKGIGWIPVLGIFGIGTSYAIIMGWVLRYLWGSVTGVVTTTENTGAYFGAICGPFGSLPWHLLALGIAFIVMFAGVSKGIEKVSKLFMPLFFVLFLYMAVRVAFLPGAGRRLSIFEAYGDYMPLGNSAACLVNRYPNVIVTRSFSKGFGMAGLRLGYGISSLALVALLKKLALPFQCNSIARELAVALLDSEADVIQMEQTAQKKASVLASLQKLHVAFTSETTPIMALYCADQEIDLQQSTARQGLPAALCLFVQCLYDRGRFHRACSFYKQAQWPNLVWLN